MVWLAKGTLFIYPFSSRAQTVRVSLVFPQYTVKNDFTLHVVVLGSSITCVLYLDWIAAYTGILVEKRMTHGTHIYIFLEYTKDLLIILITVQELNIEGLQNFSLRLDHRSLRFMFRYYTNYRQPKFGQLYNQIK